MLNIACFLVGVLPAVQIAKIHHSWLLICVWYLWKAHVGGACSVVCTKHRLCRSSNITHYRMVIKVWRIVKAVTLLIELL